MNVVKRNGRSEVWNRHKLVSSMTNAGVPHIEAELIASLIYENLTKKGIQTVQSTYLREKVIAILISVESNCAESFEYFSKTASE